MPNRFPLFSLIILLFSFGDADDSPKFYFHSRAQTEDYSQLYSRGSVQILDNKILVVVERLMVMPLKDEQLVLTMAVADLERKPVVMAPDKSGDFDLVEILSDGNILQCALGQTCQYTMEQPLSKLALYTYDQRNRKQVDTVRLIEFENNQIKLTQNCVTAGTQGGKYCFCKSEQLAETSDLCAQPRPILCSAESIATTVNETPRINRKFKSAAFILTPEGQKRLNVEATTWIQYPSYAGQRFSTIHRLVESTGLHEVYLMMHSKEHQTQVSIRLDKNHDLADNQLVYFPKATCDRSQNGKEDILCVCEGVSVAEVHHTTLIRHKAIFQGVLDVKLYIAPMKLEAKTQSLIELWDKTVKYKIRDQELNALDGGQKIQLEKADSGQDQIWILIENGDSRSSIAQINTKFGQIGEGKCYEHTTETQCACVCPKGTYDSALCPDTVPKPLECVNMRIDHNQDIFSQKRAAIQMEFKEYYNFDKSGKETPILINGKDDPNADDLAWMRYKMLKVITDSQFALEFWWSVTRTQAVAADVRPIATTKSNFGYVKSGCPAVYHFRSMCTIADGKVTCVCCGDDTENNDPVCEEMPAEEQPPPPPPPENPDGHEGEGGESEEGKKPDDPEQPGPQPGPDPGPNPKPKTTKKPKEEPEEPKPTEKPKPEEKQCKDVESTDERELCEMSREGKKMDNKNMGAVAEKVKKAFDPKNVTADGVHFVSTLISEMSTVANLSPQQQTQVFGLIDSVMSVDAAKMDGAAAKLTEAVENIAKSAEKIDYSGKELAIHKEAVDCSDEHGWMGISDDGEKFSSVDMDSNQKASIQLENEGLCGEKGKPSAYFVIYRNSKLFTPKSETPNSRKKRSTEQKKEEKEKKEENENKIKNCNAQFEPTNDMVLTSVVQNNDDAQINAKLRFQREDFPAEDSLHSALVVTWWTGEGWATEQQCQLSKEKDQYVAHCDHLTNFALLIQRNGADPLLCDPTLDKLGFWLSATSAIALMLLVLIYATRGIPKLRDNLFVRFLNCTLTRKPDFTSVCLTVALFVFYSCFALFSDQTFLGLERPGCSVAAGIMYYMFISSVVLTIFQGWNLMLICASSSQSELLLARLVKWQVVGVVAVVVPAVIVLAMAVIKADFFYRDDQFCWIQPRSIILAVIIPVSIMLLNSVFASIMFALKLVPEFSLLNKRPTFVKLSDGTAKKRSEAVQKFVALFLLQFSLGIPWVLQYPAAFSPNPTAWHYAFAILNGLGGVVVLFVYIYGRSIAGYRMYLKGSSNSGSSASD